MHNIKHAITLIFFLVSGNVKAVTLTELSNTADCIAALSISSVDFQMRGDYQNKNVGDAELDRIFKIFYRMSKKYFERNPSENTMDRYVYVNQMPSRAGQNYSLMSNVAQLKYASQIIRNNNCFQIKFDSP
jgi:hypothetical protein